MDFSVRDLVERDACESTSPDPKKSIADRQGRAGIPPAGRTRFHGGSGLHAALRHVGIFHANEVAELLDPQPSMADLFEEKVIADTGASCPD
jgi:hypothetical protein